MKIGEYYISKKQLLTLLAVLIGLAIAVYLVQVQQIIKSRASSDINAGLMVTDEQGSELQYQGNNTYTTNSTRIKMGIKNLEELK